MLARTLSKTLISFAGSLGALVYLCGCEGESSPPVQVPQSIKVHSIKLVYPPEARNLITQAVDRINAKNIQLSNGSVVRVSAASFDNLAALDKIGTPKMPATLWVAPSTPLAASARRSSLSDIKIEDCDSIMSTKLGLAYRSIDTFAMPLEGGAIDVKKLLLAADPSASPAVVAGSPRFTSSGLAAALCAASVGSSKALYTLTSDAVAKDVGEIRKTQQVVRNYFISDYDTLTWLNDREGGEPVAVFTTEQGYRNHRAYNSKSVLQWAPSTGPEYTLDYPLCTISNKTDSAQDIEAAKAVRLTFASDEFKSLIGTAGFSPAASLGDINSAQLGAVGATLIAEWTKIRRPSMTIFVLDASIKTDRMTMETLRREIKLFIDGRPSPDDSVAIISASSTPDIISEPSTNAELLQIALAKLSTTGGNAIRDGIQTAFSIFSDQNSRNYRRAVVVFTSSKDTSSQTSINQLTNRASQLVGRKNVDLFVFGLGGQQTDFGELPTLTQQVGGVFIRSDLASLPSDLFPVARRIQ